MRKLKVYVWKSATLDEWWYWEIAPPGAGRPFSALPKDIVAEGHAATQPEAVEAGLRALADLG
jgi:hypothetical protein